MARDLGGVTLGLASETGFPLIDGADTALLQFPAFGGSQALRISPQTGSDTPITSWAVGFDVYLPQPS
ncbi:MAG: hypothetical protein AAGD47_02425 [Pseudomonadota bacterium]